MTFITEQIWSGNSQVAGRRPFFLISSGPIFTYMWDLKALCPRSAERGPDFSGCPFWEQNPQRGTLKMIALSPHVFNTFSCFWQFALRTNSHLWSCYIRSLDRHCSAHLRLFVPQSVETIRRCETPFPETGRLCVIKQNHFNFWIWTLFVAPEHSHITCIPLFFKHLHHHWSQQPCQWLVCHKTSYWLTNSTYWLQTAGFKSQRRVILALTLAFKHKTSRLRHKKNSRKRLIVCRCNFTPWDMNMFTERADPIFFESTTW